MKDLHPTLSAVLIDRYTANAARVRELAAPLTNAQFWQKPFPYGNSFGHLVLHLTGNLNYYVGAQIAQTGYIRDRPREFNDPNPPSKDEALQRFDDAVEMFSRRSTRNHRKIGRRNIRASAPTPRIALTWSCSAPRICNITSGR
jgi:hypothetical protein